MCGLGGLVGFAGLLGGEDEAGVGLAGGDVRALDADGLGWGISLS